MQRVNKQPDKQNEVQVLKQQLQNLSVLVARANLANRLGLQYGGDRNLYEALGYPATIKYEDYYLKWKRHEIAKAVIDRPVKVTWDGELSLLEGKDDEETKLEKAWDELNDRLKLKSIFNRADKLAGIGRYSVLFLGFNDVQNNEGFAEPVKNAKQLLYVIPVGEDNAQIESWDQKTNSERFGLPEFYTIKISEPGYNNKTQDIKVHHTRIVHIVDDILESEVEGHPRLEVVYNRLLDLDKVVGGSAEMFWRGARGGYQGVVDKDYNFTKENKDDLQNQVDEYEHNLRRFFINKGITLESLQQALESPKDPFDVLISCVASITHIPKRILMGTERGELSSKQDTNEWDAYVQTRREEFAEPRIIRPFVDILIKYGALPKPTTSKYDIKWSDLFAKSDEQLVKIGKERTTAIKEYASEPFAQDIMPPDAFYEFCLGLNSDQIELVKQMVEQYKKDVAREEPPVTSEEEQIIEEQITEQ